MDCAIHYRVSLHVIYTVTCDIMDAILVDFSSEISSHTPDLLYKVNYIIEGFRRC